MTENNNNIEYKKDRLVVYTALFGDYDDLIDPPEKFEGCDFVCFTDQKHLKSDIWEIRLVEECDLPPNMMNRRYKILPHLFFPEYERSLYVDANIAILKNPKELSDKYLSRFDFVAPQHFARDCVYDEAFILIRSGRVEIKKLFIQTYKYLQDGYRCQTKMAENNILLRKHKDLIVLSEKWWDLFFNGVSRDQLSLVYIAWKQSAKVVVVGDLSGRQGEYFLLSQHKEKISSARIAKFFRMIFFGYTYWLFVRVILFFKNA